MTDHEAISFEVRRRLYEQPARPFDRGVYIAAGLGAIVGLILLAMLLLLRASGQGPDASDRSLLSLSEGMTQDWGAGGQLPRPDFSRKVSHVPEV